jgi:hypothetical protein
VALLRSTNLGLETQDVWLKSILYHPAGRKAASFASTIARISSKGNSGNRQPKLLPHMEQHCHTIDAKIQYAKACGTVLSKSSNDTAQCEALTCTQLKQTSLQIMSIPDEFPAMLQ